MPGRTPRCVPVAALSTLTVLLALTGCGRSATDRSTPPESVSATSAPVPPTSSPAATSAPATRTSSPAKPTSPPPARHAARAGQALPLTFGTGSATQVITVTAPSQDSTRASLQAWARHGESWTKVGSAVPAYLGRDGLTSSPSESKAATPMGSFTLTQAFGRDADPGTALPYFRTTPADWWISQSGPQYNMHQHCASNCPFTQGNPNEHLYYERPYYDYALVIDYNTRNAGTVRQGAGSAVFLHVTVGEPTAGCVSIPREQLVRILRWLTPSAHPRILIGVD